MILDIRIVETMFRYRDLYIENLIFLSILTVINYASPPFISFKSKIQITISVKVVDEMARHFRRTILTSMKSNSKKMKNVNNFSKLKPIASVH